MFVKAWLFAREVRKERYTVLNNKEMMPRRMREDMFKELYAMMCRI
jgi:glycerol-1-phosphate dehydrogenase [NAD(P)+]